MTKYTKISSNIDELIIDNPKTEKRRLVWLNIRSPKKREIEYLRKNYNFEIKHLQASSSRITSQRPVINHHQDYVFMILQFPIFRDNKVQAEEIDFFIGHGFLITLHNGNIKALQNFFNRYRKDGDSFLAYKLESSAILLYELLDVLTTSRYHLLDENSIKINEVDDKIFEQQQKEAVSQILILRRNIITIRRIIQSHKNIFKKLIEMESRIVPAQEIKKYYNKIIETSKRIWEITENQKEMIEVLYDTNESLLNYKISDVMKTLTIFSVIVFPLTLFAAIFGMNTMKGMPFIENPYGFWIVLGLMIIMGVGMLAYFDKKDWL